MANIFTVESLAAKYANANLAQDATPQVRNKAIFDFKITGFNASTVALIVSAALAIFTGSILLCAIAYLAYQVRKAFLHSVLTAGVEQGDNLIARIGELNPARTKQEIAQYLGIQDANWDFTHSQILQFRLWMNTTASAAAAPAIEPVAGNGNAVEVAAQ